MAAVTRWLRGSKALESEIVEHTSTMMVDSNELKRASEEVEVTPATTSAESEQVDELADASVQPAPRRGPGRPRKNANQTPTKALSVKAAETTVRRSTRACSRKSENLQATTSDQDDMPATLGTATTPAPSMPEVALAGDEEMKMEDNIVVSVSEPAANEQSYIPGDHAAQTPERGFVPRSEEREPPLPDAPTPMLDSTTFVPTPNTSNQTLQPLGGLYKSKYAQIPTAECSPGKRSLAGDGIEDQSDHGGAQPMKRVRLVDNTCRPGPSTAMFPNNQTVPSEWSGYVWAPANTTMRYGEHSDVSSDREETEGRSTADRDTVEREVTHRVMIKQEPLADDVPTPPPSNPSTYVFGIPMPPISFQPPQINQAPTWPDRIDNLIRRVAPLPGYIEYDLWQLCTPQQWQPGDRRLSTEDMRLLNNLQTKVNKILDGGAAKVDVLSSLPAWMRAKLSISQRNTLNKLHRHILRLRRTHQPDNGRGNPVAAGPAPVPARPAPAPQTRIQTQPLARAATTQPQTQPSAPQQGGQVLALSDLDINNLSGMPLVNSAIQKINELLRLAGQDNVQFSLSGRDKLILDRENRP
ncbi:hypothetical protein PTMSG1_08832 [Pyrenophora teres f. maculata]|nr:hypothetical protein PTMSG1_08832 [Pyrenophora teres f. maculata]